MMFSEFQSYVSRRLFMEQAARTFLGVSLLPGAALSAAVKKDAEPSPPAHDGKKGGTAKHVIFLCMNGAMTHLDTFDLKPGRETQGETKGIATNVPGMQFGETLPELAKVANELAVIRTLHTETGDHDGGRYLLRTSYKNIATIRHPGMGAWALKILGRQNKTLPDNVLISGDARHPGAGFLEPAYTPIPIGDPNAGLQNTVTPKYLTEASFEKRLELINKFDSGFRKKYPQKQVDAYTEFYRQANQLVHSEELKAFDLNQEKPDVRDKYGRDQFGQGCLLARRLVEHDVRYIEIGLGGWDMHTDIYQNDKLPAHAANLDRAASVLIQDLKSKGLLEKTLVVLGTEFGRSPQINANGGRDHHPGVFSGFFAGGGIRGGCFYGRSDQDGLRPEEDGVTMSDFNATIAHALGLPLKEEFHSKSGRPFKVAHDGDPLLKLFA
ncbi:DUF1501 domain-containing protein [Schlesneria paludicola]|uniref:DUF1501 domain-containing protein n=1 Tax=Schlesneria paludicola TaxID=360056 RepID=UPI0004925045|nr:DUF1501 domain-containing protein [Schlesneria paludicola]